MIKTIFYNLLIFFVLGNVLFWSIPTITAIDNWVLGRAGQPRAEFHSFVGWRQQPQRATVNQNTSGSKKAYFFGGSTMFGLGFADRDTLPSLVSAATGIHSENYGTIGYVSHQSLVLLLELVQSGHRPDFVIFYDGANDVTVKCEKGMTPQSHGSEMQIRSMIRGRDSPNTFTYYFRPVVGVAERFNGLLFRTLPTNQYDCDTDAVKAQTIAANLVADWRVARLLTESVGGTFIGILQPVAYFSRTPLDQIRTPPAYLDLQYRAVYPLVREQVARETGLYDLVTALDVDEPVYTDFNHVTPRGNAYVARRISEILAKR